MAVFNNFEDLPVWKEAEDLAFWIYKLTKVGNWLKIGAYPTESGVHLFLYPVI